MPSHSDVAKRIFDDAKEHTSLAVESLELEVGQLKAEIKKLQQ
jgi:hypothetical protein